MGVEQEEAKAPEGANASEGQIIIVTADPNRLSRLVLDGKAHQAKGYLTNHCIDVISQCTWLRNLFVPKRSASVRLDLVTDNELGESFATYLRGELRKQKLGHGKTV